MFNEKEWYKTMFKFIKQAFMLLLSSSGSLARIAKFSDSTKCLSLNNKPCLARATLIDLNSNKLHYYPFMGSSDRCNWSCNTLDDLSGRVYVLNKTKDINLNVFNMQF